MQYSVHTIKVKEIQNLYKTKHGRKIQLEIQREGPRHPDRSLCSAPDRLDRTHEMRNTDFLELSVFKRIEHIF